LNPEPFLEDVGAHYPAMRLAGSGVRLKVARILIARGLVSQEEKQRVAGKYSRRTPHFNPQPPSNAESDVTAINYCDWRYCRS